MEMEKTPAQKAAETRRRRKEEYKESEQNRKNMIAALERIIQDECSSWEAVHNALFLLAKVYTR